MKVIGVDIGGTEIKGSIIDHFAQIKATSKTATKRTEGRTGILESLFHVIDTLLEQDPDIAGIGVGTAGRVNPCAGDIVYATANLPGWQGTELEQLLEVRYNKASFIENDANTALLGEMWKGLDKSYHSVTMLTLGTGVGGANMINGHLFNGNHYQSGEWGHVILVPGGRPCNCGMQGCLEQYLSGRALLEQVNQLTNDQFQHGRDIFIAFDNGHEQVKQVVAAYINYLALAIYNISVALDPEAVILGGGVIDSKEQWWPILETELAQYNVQTDVLPAKLGNQAGMFGAAKLVLDVLEQREGIQ